MATSAEYVFMDGHLLPAAAALAPVFDRAFLFGDGIFETMKVRRGRPVFFAEHCRRLQAGMEAAGFPGSLDPGELERQALALAEANGVGEGRLRITLSRGTPPAAAGIDPGDDLQPRLLLTLEPFAGHPPELYRRGVDCITVAGNRGRYAHIKSTGLLATVLARRQAHAAGAFEALFTDGDGRILEGSISNFFCLRDGVLVTAPEEMPILAGVTRAKVLALAAELELPVELAAPDPAGLERERTAAFLTGSVLGICPVRAVDGKKLARDPELIDSLRRRLDQLEQQSVA